MKLNFIFKNLCLVLSFVIAFLSLTACDQPKKEPNVVVSITQSSVSSTSLTISVNENPSKIAFSEALPELHSTFGNQNYDFYAISLTGIVSLENAKLSAIPTKEDGTTLNYPYSFEDLAYFTDYLQFGFKVSSTIRTIKVGSDSIFISIDENRLIDNYYYLNFKYLYLSKNKESIQPFDYGLSNFIYIETRDNDNKTLNQFILKLSYDLIFV